MGKSLYELLQEQESYSKGTAKDNRKIKRFLKIAIPIFIIEIITITCLLVYFVILPKNTLRINTNRNDAVIYINGKEKNNIRLEKPKEEQENYAYTFNLEILIPQDGVFKIVFKPICEDGDKIIINTNSAFVSNNIYSRTINGREKTSILSGVTIYSEEVPKNINIVIEITITKAENT